jgi:hypothetical protein
MADEVLFVLLLMARHGPQEIELDLPPVWKHYAREIACEKHLNSRGMHVDYFHGVCRFFALKAAIVMVRHWVDCNPVHSSSDVHLRTPEGRCFTKLGTLAYVDKDFGQVHSMIGIERVDSVLVGSRLKMREYLGGDNANWWYHISCLQATRVPFGPKICCTELWEEVRGGVPHTAVVKAGNESAVEEDDPRRDSAIVRHTKS